MIDMNKLSLEYVPLQDRLRLTVEDQNAEVRRFWLTARLTIVVVEHLVGRLKFRQGLAAAKTRNKTQPGGQGSPGHEHQASAPGRPAPSPVLGEAASPARTELVHAVDVGTRGESFVLTVRGETNMSMQLSMTAVQLGQWLQMVYHQFLRAGWPLAVWPDWFVPKPVAPATTQSLSVH